MENQNQDYGNNGSIDVEETTQQFQSVQDSSFSGPTAFTEDDPEDDGTEEFDDLPTDPGYGDDEDDDLDKDDDDLGLDEDDSLPTEPDGEGLDLDDEDLDIEDEDDLDLDDDDLDDDDDEFLK